MQKNLLRLYKMPKKNPKILLSVIVVIFVLFFVAKTASFYPFLFHLFFDKDINLQQTNNKINVLILGIGGGKHEGPNLTDTIILANIDQKNNKVNLISIPRDLWLPDLTGQDKKINNAYSQGEIKRKGGGIPLAKAAIGKITGQPIDYVVRVDFAGFIKAVDVIGGLDINVENSFDDYQYPISGKEDDPCDKTPEELQSLATQSAEQVALELPCRYKQLHFDKGITHMNGETALEFVRSRHAAGDEGTDFARSKRQEKVIKAFKDKILSAQTLINPAKLLGLYAALKSSFDTNIQSEEFDDFIRLGQKLGNAKIKSVIIDTGDKISGREGLLINPPITKVYNYEWVLIPKTGNGNFLEIHNYINCEISIDDCSLSKIQKN